MSASVDTLLARLAAAERRLVEHASAPVPDGLTEPDPGGRGTLGGGPGVGPPRRVSGLLAGTGPVHHRRRIRSTSCPLDESRPTRNGSPPSSGIATRIRRRSWRGCVLPLEEVGDDARAWDGETWRRLGSHPTRGEMTVERIVEEFIVNHLEEHADQLDALAGDGNPVT